jgi:hypothetical protein
LDQQPVLASEQLPSLVQPLVLTSNRKELRNRKQAQLHSSCRNRCRSS